MQLKAAFLFTKKASSQAKKCVICVVFLVAYHFSNKKKLLLIVALLKCSFVGPSFTGGVFEFVVIVKVFKT